MNSFFGFDTTLPPLRPDELTTLEEDKADKDDLDKQIEDYALETGENCEVYDFEEDLAGKLEEEGDDLNDETFADSKEDIGTDFDWTKYGPLPKRDNEDLKESTQSTQPIQPIQLIRSTISSQSTHTTRDFKPASVDNLLRYPSPLSVPSTSHISLSAVNPPSIPHTTSPPPPGFNHTLPTRTSVSSLEEIEAQFISQQMQQAQRSQRVQGMQKPQRLQSIPPIQSFPQIQPQSSPQTDKIIYSLAEVEAALMNMNINGRQQMLMFPPVDTSFLERETSERDASTREQEAWLLEREKRRLEKQRKMVEMAKYNGLMTQGDKDYVNRIQISQLVTDDPYSDDFYYQVYAAMRNRQDPNIGTFSPNFRSGGGGYGGHGGYDRGRHRNRGSDNGLLKMQQQLLRIVQDAKRKPKLTQLSLEGALGKITINSVRNPRQLLQVSSKHEPSHHPGTSSTSTHQRRPSLSLHGVAARKKVLRAIENVYNAVLKLEELRRNQPNRSRGYVGENEKEAFENWNNEYTEVARTMWEELSVMEPTSISHTHPFIAILSISKGKKVTPRALRHCHPDQILAMLTMLVANFESLDVCKNEIWNQAEMVSTSVMEEVELFMNTVVPPLLQFITEAPLKIVIGLLALFIERNNIICVAKSKVGLAFLTMFLSRAEILKQGRGSMHSHPQTEEREFLQWQELYSHLFTLLQTHFLSLFPPFITGIDDMYVWQFLAAMAVGASHEQQSILVTEVRERVMETLFQVKLQSDKAYQKINNVNLFLHALGLDASQISI